MSVCEKFTRFEYFIVNEKENVIIITTKSDSAYSANLPSTID